MWVLSLGRCSQFGYKLDIMKHMSLITFLQFWLLTEVKILELLFYLNRKFFGGTNCRNLKKKKIGGLFIAIQTFKLHIIFTFLIVNFLLHQQRKG
jgi:hypothetical protein